MGLDAFIGLAADSEVAIKGLGGFFGLFRSCHKGFGRLYRPSRSCHNGFRRFYEVVIMG